LAEEPVIVDMADRQWEAWPEDLVEERGDISWKTLVSADQTRSEALTFGVARLAPRECSHEHHHAQAELYFVLAGSGEVTIDGQVRSVGPGTCVFIPGQARHSCANRGPGELRFAYVLAADSFSDVEYIFERDVTRHGRRAGIDPAGAEGLEPPTPGFGDRCSTS